jgi:hypothetical protein
LLESLVLQANCRLKNQPEIDRLGTIWFISGFVSAWWPLALTALLRAFAPVHFRFSYKALISSGVYLVNLNARSAKKSHDNPLI